MEICKNERQTKDLIDTMQDILNQACRLINDMIIQESTRYIEKPRYDFKRPYRLKRERYIDRGKVKELKNIYMDILRIKDRMVNNV